MGVLCRLCLMEMIDTDFVQGSPLLSGPIPAQSPLPFFRYIWTMRDNAIAGFHEGLFQQQIVETRLWKLHTFIVNDPSSIRHVLIDNAANYIKGNIEQRISRTWPDKDFATSDEKRWRQRRQTMSSSFSHHSTPGTSSVILDAANRVLDRWRTLPRETVIDASAEMTTKALEVISRVVFSSDNAEFIAIMERCFAALSARTDL